MNAKQWESCNSGEEMILALIESKKRTPPMFWERFSCFCARQTMSLLDNASLVRGVELAHLHIDGQATPEELQEASFTAHQAVYVDRAKAPKECAGIVAFEAILAAAYPLQKQDAALYAARYAAQVAGGNGSKDQAQWIKLNINNPFTHWSWIRI